MENPKNLIIVIFGASGDLTSRKLIPAIFSLKSQKLMPEKYAIIGIGRTKYETEEFRKKMGDAIVTFSEEKVTDRDLINSFTEDLYYLSTDYSSVISSNDIPWHVTTFLQGIDDKYGIGGNYIFIWLLLQVCMSQLLLILQNQD